MCLTPLPSLCYLAGARLMGYLRTFDGSRLTLVFDPDTDATN
jgi:hypothetical protein